MSNPTHHIKVREKGKKRFSFLSRNGVTNLRIHAIQFTKEGADKLIAENAARNPEWEFVATEI